MASNIVFDGTKGISLPSFTTTEKNAIVSPATGATVFDTTQNRQNVYAGGAWNAGLNSGTAVASTSGTSIDFTGIPSWVKRITVMFNGVSTNGSSSPQIQIGSGSISTSSYQSMGMAFTASNSGGSVTSGFVIRSGSATSVLYGHAVLTLISGNTWIASINMADYTNGALFLTDGVSPALSGALDRVRITTVNGTDAFDAGSINILYE